MNPNPTPKKWKTTPHTIMLSSTPILSADAFESLFGDPNEASTLIGQEWEFAHVVNSPDVPKLGYSHYLLSIALMWDGSGIYELITPPISLTNNVDEDMRRMNNFFAWLYANRVDSETNQITGRHVHVSVTGHDYRTVNFTEQIYRMLMGIQLAIAPFIWGHYNVEGDVIRVAAREGANRYARYDPYGITDHHNAISLSRRKEMRTLEFRLFEVPAIIAWSFIVGLVHSLFKLDTPYAQLVNETRDYVKRNGSGVEIDAEGSIIRRYVVRMQRNYLEGFIEHITGWHKQFGELMRRYVDNIVYQHAVYPDNGIAKVLDEEVIANTVAAIRRSYKDIVTIQVNRDSRYTLVNCHICKEEFDNAEEYPVNFGKLVECVRHSMYGYLRWRRRSPTLSRLADYVARDNATIGIEMMRRCISKIVGREVYL